MRDIGDDEAILLEIKLHRVPRKHLEWRIPTFERPIAIIGCANLDANELYGARPPNHKSYYRQRIDGPGETTRSIFVAKEEEWILDGLLRIGNQQLEQVFEEGVKHGIRSLGERLGMMDLAEEVIRWRAWDRIPRP